MDNEKPKRIRTAHIAFVQKTMDGATGILVKPITYKIHQGKTYGIEIYREQKPGNYPKTGWNNSGKHYAESAIMQFSLYGSLWVQWCRKRLGCRILDLVDTQKFFISPRPPHSCLDLPCSMVCIFQAVDCPHLCQQCFMKVWVCVCIGFSEFNKQAMCKISCSHFSPSCCLYYLFKQSTAHISFWLSFAILWVDWSINNYNKLLLGCLSLKIIRKPSIIF